MEPVPNFPVVGNVHQHLFEKSGFLLPLDRQQSKMMPGVWLGMGSSMGSIHGRFILETDRSWTHGLLRLVHFSQNPIGVPIFFLIGR